MNQNLKKERTEPISREIIHFVVSHLPLSFRKILPGTFGESPSLDPERSFIDFHADTRDNSLSMKGKIRTKEKCSVCKGKFKELPRGIVCTRCGTSPNKYFIDLGRYKGARLKLYSDDSGFTLDSYIRANRMLESIRNQIDRKVFDPKDYVKREAKAFCLEIRLNDWLMVKEKEVKAGELSPSYIRELKRYCESYFLSHFSHNTDVREITGPSVNAFHRSLPDHLSAKTRQNILAAFKSFMSFLEREGWIKKKPDFPKIDVPDASWTWIDFETQEEILSKMRKKFVPIFLFMMRHGVRPGEACALKWADVDLIKGTITIRRTFSNRQLREVTKTKKIRFLPINSEMLKWMKRQQSRFPESIVFQRNNKGEPFYDRALRKEWKRVTVPMGLDLRIYDGTRHSFASQAVNSGTPLNLIQDAMGHTDPSTTKRYAHTDIESLRKLVEPAGKVVSIRKRKKKR